MLERGKMDRGVVEIIDTESLVPKGHLLRKIDAAVDFNRIYEMVESRYSEDNKLQFPSPLYCRDDRPDIHMDFERSGRGKGIWSLALSL